MKLTIKTPQLPNYVAVMIGGLLDEIRTSVADLTDEDIDGMALDWRDAMKKHRDKMHATRKADENAGGSK